MKNGKQQHYSKTLGSFETSMDRFSGEFEATPEEAQAIYRKAKTGCRLTRETGLPILCKIEG
jgi:hypothetical protein